MGSKKILAITMPIVAVTAIGGSAFCAWYFGEETLDPISKNISVYMTTDVNKGVLTALKSPSKLVFSQGLGEASDLKDGIDFYTLNDGDTTYSLNDEVVVKYSLLDANDSIEGGSFRVYIDIGGTSLPDYVKLSEEYEDATDLKGGHDFSADIEKISDVSLEDPNGYFKYTLNLNKAIEYKNADVKPNTRDKYQNLQKALADANITIRIVVI